MIKFLDERIQGIQEEIKKYTELKNTTKDSFESMKYSFLLDEAEMRFSFNVDAYTVHVRMNKIAQAVNERAKELGIEEGELFPSKEFRDICDKVDLELKTIFDEVEASLND